MSIVHIVYGGEGTDYPQGDLDVGPESTDAEVLDALANVAGIPRVKLNAFIVHPPNPETGDITVSPRALFGDEKIGIHPLDQRPLIESLHHIYLKEVHGR